MFDLPILTNLIFLPVFVALLILLMPGNGDKHAKLLKLVTFITGVVCCFMSFWLVAHFDVKNPGFQFTEDIVWISGYNINYSLGVDGVSVLFILLTNLLVPICILASWTSITTRVREFCLMFLLLDAAVIGAFCALDFMLFYIFFESMLIPMYLIIGVWGGENRIYAAYKFFLYTLIGSLLLLLAILYIYNVANTMNIVILQSIIPKLSPEEQKILWLAFFAAFAIKVPMWPFHTWLPDAHVQAPTAGSVFLAGILLKMGAYGFLRFSLPLLPDASIYFQPFIATLSVIAIIYASLVALIQRDMKKMIAYSSVAHMGYVTIGIFSFSIEGINGALFQMLSHGLVSSGLFLAIGILYERMRTKEIDKYGGVAHKMPVFALFFMIYTLASVALPGTSGFVGELLSLIGSFKISNLFGILAASGVILGATYMLWLYKRVMFGEIKNKEVAGLKDLNLPEFALSVPLVVLIIAIGIYPSIATDIFSSSVEHLIKQVVGVDE